MWLFNKTTSLIDCGFLRGYIDHHSHLLPGVDDGMPTTETSLQALAKLEDYGVTAVWLTPHIMEDIPNTTAHLRSCLAGLTDAYAGKIHLRLAAEYMLDNLFEERLAANDLLPIGLQGRHVLVETSYLNPPIDLPGMLKRIMAKGYYPLLAHPERYRYMGMYEYRQLKQMHIRFQLNLPSLAGMYGEKVQQKAIDLLRAGMYDVSGSDIHALHTFELTVSARWEGRLQPLLPLQPLA